MNEPYVAVEYARLIVKYYDDNFPKPIQQSNSILCKFTDTFEPVPVAILEPYIREFLETNSGSEIKWLIAEYIYDNSHNMLKYSLLKSEDLAEVYRITLDFISLITNIIASNVIYYKNGRIEVRSRLRGEPTPTLMFLYELLLSTWAFDLVQYMQVEIKELNINSRNEDFAEALNRLLVQLPSVEATYKPGKHTIRFTRQLVRASNPKSESRLTGMLIRELELKLSSMPRVESWKEKVLFYLESHVQDNVNFDDVCAYFHQSRRTMYRLIKSEDTTFKELYNEVRKEKVLELIEKSIPIKRVASLSGFNSQSAFSLNFKGWFGMTPASYRKTIKSK